MPSFNFKNYVSELRLRKTECAGRYAGMVCLCSTGALRKWPVDTGFRSWKKGILQQKQSGT